MAFTPGFDIGNFTPEFSAESYVAESGKVFTPDTMELDSLPIEWSPSLYVTPNLSKLFNSSFIIPARTIDEWGTIYSKVTTELPKNFTNGVPLYVTALPVEPGDDGQLIIVGAICDFTYDIVSDNPHVVLFTDLSFGDVIEWTWDFDDGSFSNVQNPIHDFEPGTYKVRLDVIFGSGATGFAEKTIVLLPYPPVTELPLDSFQGDIKVYDEILVGVTPFDVRIRDDNRDIEQDLTLETAVMLSLFTDKPDEGETKGGWGGSGILKNMSEGSFILGSKLWLLSRDKIGNDLLIKCKEYALDSLKWLYDFKIAEDIQVEVDIKVYNEVIITIDIIRPLNNKVSYRYYYNWVEQIYRR